MSTDTKQMLTSSLGWRGKGEIGKSLKSDESDTAPLSKHQFPFDAVYKTLKHALMSDIVHPLQFLFLVTSLL